MNTGKNLTNYGNSQFLTEEIEVKPKVLMFYKNLIIVGVRTGKLLVKDFFGQCCDVEILEHSLWDVKCRIRKGYFNCYVAV